MSCLFVVVYCGIVSVRRSMPVPCKQNGLRRMWHARLRRAILEGGICEGLVEVGPLPNSC